MTQRCTAMTQQSTAMTQQSTAKPSDEQKRAKKGQIMHCDGWRWSHLTRGGRDPTWRFGKKGVAGRVAMPFFDVKQEKECFFERARRLIQVS